MLRQILSLVVCVFVFSAVGFAQGTVTGTVTNAETGETLPGANVVIQELTIGASADVDGEYTIENVPNGTYTIVASFISYQRHEQTVQVSGGETVVNFELAPDYFGLEEIVVTGVGQGTETTKLGFSMGKVGEDELEAVPASNPANALRGKLAGVTIVQASGDPTSAPDIRLRGSTSMTSGLQPLLIVDGVITNGSMQDISMSNVESIEVIKGAAASSLYGSLAGNGVIQIITKRNAEDVGAPQFTIRSEYGFSELAAESFAATTHPYVMDDLVRTNDGENPDPNGQYILSWPGYSNGEYSEDRRFDNEYPMLHDNVDAMFGSKPYMTNNFALANTGEDYNYRVSFNNHRASGVVEPLDDYVRNTLRFNADYVPTDRLSATISASYITAEGPNVSEQGQGDSFYSALTAAPVFDFTEKNEDGEYKNDFIGYSALGENWQNPLYTYQQREWGFARDRIIAGVTVEYALTDNLNAIGRQSVDKRWTNNKTFYPVGYTTPGSPSSNLINGNDSRSINENSTSITELWLEYGQEFGDINVSSILKYLYEDRESEGLSASGYNYPVAGIRDLGATESSTHSVNSGQQVTRAENIILNVDMDYQDKIIASAMVRRDGNSRFGSEERWQTYYRGSLAYRLTEDFEINNINEWKVRASYGVAGQRPPWQAQYETFNASSDGISPGTLGNEEIKPSKVAEFEVGTNITFLDRFNFEANYAFTQVENDYLSVPLSSVAGFSSQWQNVGEIENSSIELTLSGYMVDTRDFSWNANLNWFSVTQEVTDMGGVPPFTRSGGTAASIFRFEAGVPYGEMYGNIALTSLDQLTVVDGEVLNAGIDTNGDGTITRDDYMINQHGWVVPAGTHGTADEQITYMVDEDGSTTVGSMGNTNPDFSVGFSNSLNYKGIGLYVLLDWVQGPDVYNYTKQLMYFNNRHEDAETFAEQGFDVGYTDGGSAAYNAAQPSSYFVEDASYMKLREVALSYTLTQNTLGFLGDYISELRLSVSGRNLLTFTDYTGWDPEVADASNATNYRIDEYMYPNYRTYTGSLEIRF